MWERTLRSEVNEVRRRGRRERTRVKRRVRGGETDNMDEE